MCALRRCQQILWQQYSLCILFNLAKHNGNTQNIINSNATHTRTHTNTYLFCWLARDFQLAYIPWPKMNVLRISKQIRRVFFPHFNPKPFFRTHPLCIIFKQLPILFFLYSICNLSRQTGFGCWLSLLLLQSPLFCILNHPFAPLSNDVTVTSVHGGIVGVKIHGTHSIPGPSEWKIK